MRLMTDPESKPYFRPGKIAQRNMSKFKRNFGKYILFLAKYINCESLRSDNERLTNVHTVFLIQSYYRSSSIKTVFP